jgi:hypothetical protein
MLCNSHMNARSTPTGRRSLQVLAISRADAVRSGATVQRRLPSHGDHVNAELVPFVE